MPVLWLLSVVFNSLLYISTGSNIVIHGVTLDTAFCLFVLNYTQLKLIRCH